ncbi:MAG TPA: cyclic-di-AMP receptor [Anaerolineaceae bacterium]|nr:cyclic-di-AMP receptor [Anaerolineaceae bacterium]
MQLTEEHQEIRLLIAVVQAQDAENAISALQRLNLSVTRLPSVGGFLGRRNATLMIGTSARLEPAVMDALQRNCRQRVEYIAVPLESAPLPLPAPTPITVGGATVFNLEVERYEEI